MSFFDAADLPRASFFRDPSRQYRGLSYNCSYTPQEPKTRSLPSRRDSAVGTSMRSARAAGLSKPTSNTTISVEPEVPSDVSFAVDVETASLASDKVERAPTSGLSSEWGQGSRSGSVSLCRLSKPVQDRKRIVPSSTAGTGKGDENPGRVVTRPAKM